jgi:succinyl-diaminopimelate desuccinylase
MNSIFFTQQLIQATDTDHALRLVMEALEFIGFTCDLLEFNGVANLVASKKTTKSKKTLVFLGHVDVVPIGKKSSWKHDQGELCMCCLRDDGYSCAIFDSSRMDEMCVYGRGAADMKGGIASFLEAISNAKDIPQNVLLIITSDEEGQAEYGTRAVIEHLINQKKFPKPFFALIGEPVSLKTPGDHVKIGSRGSLNVTVMACGRSGHVAYSEYGLNPLHALLPLLQNVIDMRSKAKISETDIYGPTDIEVTSVDTANKARNMIPEAAVAKFNIRFNDDWLAEELIDEIEKIFTNSEVKYKVLYDLAGEPYLSDISSGFDMLVDSCFEVTDIKPLVSANGANSDARFLTEICPFAEVGLLAGQAHKINESANIRHIYNLSRIFYTFLKKVADNVW